MPNSLVPCLMSEGSDVSTLLPLLLCKEAKCLLCFRATRSLASRQIHFSAGLCALSVCSSLRYMFYSFATFITLKSPMQPRLHFHSCMQRPLRTSTQAYVWLQQIFIIRGRFNCPFTSVLFIHSWFWYQYHVDDTAKSGYRLGVMQVLLNNICNSFELFLFRSRTVP